MSRLQLIILWVLTLVAGAIVFRSNSKDTAKTESETKLEPGIEVFENIDQQKITGLKMVDGEDSATLQIKDNSWGVNDLNDFPADVNKLANAFDKLLKLKIVQGVPATADYYDRFGLNSNAEKEDKRPREISILGEGGEPVKTLFIGKQRQGTGGQNERSGRFVRFADDDSGVYVVNEDFYFFDEKDKSWLLKTFPSLEKPLKIEMTPLKGNSDKAWTLSRKNVSDNLELEGLSDERQTVAVATAPLKNIFTGSTNFTELVTEEETKERREENEGRKVTISTNDGAVYEFLLWPEKSTTPDEDDQEDGKKQPDSRNYFVTFTVTSDPKPPTDPGDEASEEDKARFKADMINYKSAPERVNRHKKIAGRFFLLPNSSVKNLLKDHNEMQQPKPPKPAPKKEEPTQPSAEPAKPKATAVTPPIAIPPVNPSPDGKPRRIEAVTPPIAIPPMPKTEEPKKPAPPLKPEQEFSADGEDTNG